MTKLVIGLTGPIGSGVSTVASTLNQHCQFTTVKISDLIRKAHTSEGAEKSGTLTNLGVTRSTLQDLGNKRRSADAAYWAREAVTEANQRGIKDRLVIEGIKNPEEVEYLSGEFGTGFFLVAVTASRGVRWERVKSNYQSNEAEFSRDDERDSDEDVVHGQLVSQCVQNADYVFVNESNFGSHDNQLRRIHEAIKTDIQAMESCRRVGGSRARTPKEDEIHMAMAYAQSFSSECIKRQVGAVIVDKNGLPLSSGFNENPLGMEPCIRKFQTCFKDDLMHLALEKMPSFHCPECGVRQERLTSPWSCNNPGCRTNLKKSFFPSRNMELCTAIHAEERAIRSLMGRDASDAVMYSTTFPCFQCARYIVDCKIKRVVYVEAYPGRESKEFLLQNKVVVDAFSGFKARAFNFVFRQTT